MNIKRPSSLVVSLCLATAALGLATRALRAEVARIEIASREDYERGRAFGERGAYQRLRGRVFFQVSPQDKANQNIVDLSLASRNSADRVEFSADLEILAPADLAQANGAILYDVNNRGNRLCLGQFNGGAEGFLMRRGFVIVWSGWIAEVLPGNERLILQAPRAVEEDGEPIRGKLRAEFVADRDADRYTIAHFGNQGSYPPTERGAREATLTWRLRERDPRVLIPRAQWKWRQREVEADGGKSALPLIEVEIAGGVKAGYIYELIYEGRDPIVQGLGLAGIRDLISFLKYDASPRNPLLHEGASAARFAYGFGVSQSGRCLRMFLYDGFNADEQGRQVFDGLMPHVAGGGLGFFNHRFASPTRHNTQHDNHQYPADVFPFSYGEEKDPFTQRVDGILRRSLSADSTPKVMHVQTSSEYWHRAGSLVHTDPRAQQDAKIPPQVRIYTVGGAQHGPGSGLPGAGGNGALPRNPTDYRPLNRALLVALDQWVRDGVEPPASVYPKISDGSLVDWSAHHSGWRALPGVRYPQVIHQPDCVDRGPKFLLQRQITRQPPKLLGRYSVKVPAYGEDNNERGCLLLPTVAVPVATFTSWNLRAREIGAETELLSLAGGYIPFPSTAAERRQTGDPRASLEERYGDFDTYLERFRRHAQQLSRQRLLLEEDLPRLEQLAQKHRQLFSAPEESTSP